MWRPAGAGRTLAGIDPLGDMRMVVDVAIGKTVQIGSIPHSSNPVIANSLTNQVGLVEIK